MGLRTTVGMQFRMPMPAGSARQQRRAELEGAPSHLVKNEWRERGIFTPSLLLGVNDYAERADNQLQLGASLSRKRRYVPNAISIGIDCCHCFVSFLNPCVRIFLCSRRPLRRRACFGLRLGFRLAKTRTHIGLASDDHIDISVSLDQSRSNAPNQANHQAQHNRSFCQGRGNLNFIPVSDSVQFR
jgi:hypothetical protein